MKAFVPVEKMSKKARKELASARRKMWAVSPVPKVIENKKHDSRKRKSHDRYDDGFMGLVYCAEMVLCVSMRMCWTA